MNLTQELLKRISFYDVELSEDLSRRMPECKDLNELSNYFRMLLAQYSVDTMLLRTTIKDSIEPELWFSNFFKFIFPFIKQNGLPNYTDTKSIPMYTAISQSHS